MIAIEQQKYVVHYPPQLKDNGAPASANAYIDTLGYRHLRMMIVTGTTDVATTAAPLLQECDTTDGTYAAISSAALADAIGATEDNKIFAIDCDLTAGRKRYIRCLLTAGNGTTGTNLAVIGILSRKSFDDHDGLNTDAGLQELISV